MNINKKNIIISIVILFFGVIIITFACLSRETKAKIYGTLFNGNHITLDLGISEDDSTIESDELKLNCIYEENSTEQVIYSDRLFETKSGRHGLYNFTMQLPSNAIEKYPESLLLDLDYNYKYDWYIVYINCNIYFESDNENGDGTIVIVCWYNDGTYSLYYEDFSVENSIIYASF